MKIVNKTKTSVWSGLGVFLAFSLLSGMSFSLLSPIVSTNAANTLTTRATANINPVISVTAPSSSDYAFGTLTPTDAGAFASKSGTVLVKTNDINGYKLYISTDTSETALTSAGASTKITSCGNNVTSSTMVKDTWGYSMDGTTFKPVTASNVKIAEKTAPLTQTTAYSHTVHIGMKVSTDTQSGTYSNIVKFTAIGNTTN
jgi:hypothetical protein